jgi:hypothetical protein
VGGFIADGPEVNHSTPYRTEVKKEWSYVSLFYTPPWSGRGNITFYYCSVILETNGTYLVGGACYMRGHTVQTGLNLTNGGI